MFYFRVDGNSTISHGHIMRCLAVASELAERGESVCFLVADDDPVPVLKDYGFPYIVLHSDWKELSTDTDRVIEILDKDDHPVLLIDTYRITSDYVEKLKKHCKIAYLGSKKEYLGSLDRLSKYSTDIDRDVYESSYDAGTVRLRGPAYAP